ncbi:unnamed protein product [Lepeophtheirus salmonis]|uniref:(salmon louse) hypothetical protein n=1 Tax=Lepeophtheirus salmonis TaxID=72036 RepID=A0A7R8CCU8_LEPSM|nr:unnamed protein product [Lepeophtheirus salmonis]CAF2772853.1 unnamed protein product [Lepeophtheirus salmonis]
MSGKMSGKKLNMANTLSKVSDLKKEAGTYSCGDCQKKVTDLLIPSQSNKKNPDIKPFILKLVKMIKAVNECIPCLCKAVNRKRGISFEGFIKNEANNHWLGTLGVVNFFGAAIVFVSPSNASTLETDKYTTRRQTFVYRTSMSHKDDDKSSFKYEKLL